MSQDVAEEQSNKQLEKLRELTFKLIILENDITALAQSFVDSKTLTEAEFYDLLKLTKEELQTPPSDW